MHIDKSQRGADQQSLSSSLFFEASGKREIAPNRMRVAETSCFLSAIPRFLTCFCVFCDCGASQSNLRRRQGRIAPIAPRIAPKKYLLLSRESEESCMSNHIVMHRLPGLRGIQQGTTRHAPTNFIEEPSRVIQPRDELFLVSVGTVRQESRPLIMYVSDQLSLVYPVCTHQPAAQSLLTWAWVVCDARTCTYRQPKLEEPSKLQHG